MGGALRAVPDGSVRRALLHRFPYLSLYGILPSGLDLVEIGYYEGGGFLAIDQHGGSTLIAGEPLVSPDSQRFATLSLDLEAEYQPNVNEIWRLRAGTLRLELAVRSDEWGPSEARWRDSATVEFLQNFPTADVGTYRQQRARLVLDHDGWSLQHIPP